MVSWQCFCRFWRADVPAPKAPLPPNVCEFAADLRDELPGTWPRAWACWPEEFRQSKGRSSFLRMTSTRRHCGAYAVASMSAWCSFTKLGERLRAGSRWAPKVRAASTLRKPALKYPRRCRMRSNASRCRHGSPAPPGPSTKGGLARVTVGHGLGHAAGGGEGPLVRVAVRVHVGDIHTVFEGVGHAQTEPQVIAGVVLGRSLSPARDLSGFGNRGPRPPRKHAIHPSTSRRASS